MPCVCRRGGSDEGPQRPRDTSCETAQAAGGPPSVGSWGPSRLGPALDQRSASSVAPPPARKGHMFCRSEIAGLTGPRTTPERTRPRVHCLRTAKDAATLLQGNPLRRSGPSRAIDHLSVRHRSPTCAALRLSCRVMPSASVTASRLPGPIDGAITSRIAGRSLARFAPSSRSLGSFGIGRGD